MNHEPQRLQKLYAGLSDDELLKLAESKGELTEVAQQAIDAEVSARGLAVPEHEGKFGAMTSNGQTAEDPRLSPLMKGEATEQSEAENDPSLVELMTFQIASEAEKALNELDDHGIPVKMEPAMRRLTEHGPRIKTNWLTIFVERTRQEEAKDLLRKSMGLFPVLASDEVDHPGEGDEDILLPVGSFDVAADAETARKALIEAGIWFTTGEEDEGAVHGGANDEEVTVIEVRAQDLDRALAAVEAAFGEEE